MPADERYDIVHERTRQKPGALNGCNNRKPYKETLQVKDGFTPDGRQLFKTVPFVMTRHCHYGERQHTDPMCAGCEWIRPTQ